MQNPRKFLFLGLIFGSFVLFLFATHIAIPYEQVQAFQPTMTMEESPEIVEEFVESETLSCTLPLSYPQSIHEWCQLIETASKNYGLDSRLIAAVMLQESGGQRDAYSKSGAVGLMQVMPKDGIAEKFMCINGPCFANRPTMQELFDPSFNVDYGSRMLSNLINKHGNWRDALKAYGPMDVGYYYADLVLSIYNNYQ